jgi:hypothetical protein
MVNNDDKESRSTRLEAGSSDHNVNFTGESVLFLVIQPVRWQVVARLEDPPFQLQWL